jgi:hypothetical protein
MAQETSFDVSGAFSICFASSLLFHRLPQFHHCDVVSFGLVGALPLSCHFKVALFPPCEQLLMAVVLGVVVAAVVVW